MNKLAGLGAVGGVMAGVFAIAVLSLGGLLILRSPQTAPISGAPDPQVATPDSAVGDKSAGAAVVNLQAADSESENPDKGVADASPDMPGAPPAATRSDPPVAGAVVIPSFDVVRAELDGRTLIAGRAGAKMRVTILLDGLDFAADVADSAGNFVTFVTVPTGPRPRTLSLRAENAGGEEAVSLQTVILAPSADILLADAGRADWDGQSQAPERSPQTEGAARSAGADLPGAQPEPVDLNGPVAVGVRAAGPSDAVPLPSEIDAGLKADALLADGAPGVRQMAEETPVGSVGRGEDGEPADEALRQSRAVATTGQAPEPPVRPVGSDTAPVSIISDNGAAMTARGPSGASAGGNPAPENARVQQGAAVPGEPTNGAAVPEGPTPANVVVADASPDERIALPPRVLMADNQGIRVIQSPGDAPDVLHSVAIDSISYDALGGVVLAGRGSSDRRGGDDPASADHIRIYLDNAPVQTVAVGPDGQWRADLPEIDARVYTLRVDEIGGDGKVVSRAETPFKPEPAETVAALAAAGVGEAADQRAGNRQIAPGGASLALVTVQPGFTLWRIARENYGEGLLYVRVFEANADKIRDPDLIYPGQIFTVPQ
ncbi:LysM peptidoglycan-binding domain-containing protein [Oceaniovalibus sp. ACAM 378]|uniref:LysM peptidoglycan-binding domain-containing protein n=1 Tax=Oceaniovalibus sp. ACAM 378 TaxID=2599923 RepID=UPI0011D8AC98|nr:LysM peptidoglycan-binding domain-containing protein [Oceaniovalibus sp. ACAM 378]TYB91114.1 LysM peptidoglycan-binding domain-containing protein [Oceaniovalibus sp. ACAM 378]